MAASKRATRSGPSIADDFLAKARERLAQAAGPPIWQPHEGPQKDFYTSTADEVLFGGAAGGGKSMSAVALPIPWVGHSDLRSLVLRRRTDDLRDLLDKAKKVYKYGQKTGVRPFTPACPDAHFINSPPYECRFPAGGIIYFNHCEDANDWEKYQGQEYQIIVFEELTQFTERQYLEIKSRLRSGSPGLPRLVRATTNPGGTGHEWVFKRWRWWLNPEATIPGRAPRVGADGKPLPPAAPGEVLWIWRDEHGEEHVVPPGHPDATSRTFIPARLEDNPTLLAEDPTYRTKLRDFDPVRRAQLERGDWLAKPGKGRYFRLEWVTIVDACPSDTRFVRAWDKAATEPTPQNPDPDWTRGVKLGYSHSTGRYYIADLASTQAAPGVVKALIRNTAELDGKDVLIRLAQDPGQAGKADAADDVQKLDGFTVVTARVTGDKVTRFGGFSSQAAPQSTGGVQGRVCLVRGPWNKELIDELEAFPEGGHDDIADALSDAYDEVRKLPPPAPPPPPPMLVHLDESPIGFG